MQRRKPERAAMPMDETMAHTTGHELLARSFLDKIGQDEQDGFQVLSNSEQLTWINEQYKPLLIKAFAFQKGEVIFLAWLSLLSITKYELRITNAKHYSTF